MEVADCSLLYLACSVTIFQEEGWRGWPDLRENICPLVSHAWSFLAQPRAEEGPRAVLISLNAPGEKEWPQDTEGQGCGEEVVTASVPKRLCSWGRRKSVCEATGQECNASPAPAALRPEPSEPQVVIPPKLVTGKVCKSERKVLGPGSRGLRGCPCAEVRLECSFLRRALPVDLARHLWLKAQKQTIQSNLKMRERMSHD